MLICRIIAKETDNIEEDPSKGKSSKTSIKTKPSWPKINRVGASRNVSL